MNIKKYMQAHEALVRRELAEAKGSGEQEELLDRHERMTGRMQHERLIHLLVTLVFGIALLVTVAMALFAPSVLVFVLAGLLLALFVPYVSHYFFLENAVQRWYRLSDEIDEKLRAGK